MKFVLLILVLYLFVICSCWPVETDHINTLETVDVPIHGDSNDVEHTRLARQYGGFGGYGGPAGYGGYSGFPVFGGYYGFPLYRGSFSTAQSSAQSSSYGGGFGK